MFLHFSFILQKAISFILPSFSIPPPKTENQKAEKKEKIEKIKKKKRQNFLRFFPVAPLPLFHKKEFKKAKTRKNPSPFFSHFLLQKKKKEWKEGEKKQKKRKKRRKRKGDLFFLSPIPKRKEEEKRGKRKRKKIDVGFWAFLNALQNCWCANLNLFI